MGKEISHDLRLSVFICGYPRGFLMMKWGDFDRIDLPLVRQAARVLTHQQKIAGPATPQQAFTPARELMNHGIVQGATMEQQIGGIAAYGSTALNFFFLGYLYRLAEADQLADALAAITADENPNQGVNTDDHRDPSNL